MNNSYSFIFSAPSLVVGNIILAMFLVEIIDKLLVKLCFRLDIRRLQRMDKKLMPEPINIANSKFVLARSLERRLAEETLSERPHVAP